MHSVNAVRLQHDPSTRPPTEDLTVVPAGTLDLDESLSADLSNCYENEVFLRIVSPERVSANDLFRPEGTADPTDDVEARPARNGESADSQSPCQSLERPGGVPMATTTPTPPKPGPGQRRHWLDFLTDWFMTRRSAWCRTPAAPAAADDVASMY